VAGFDGYGSTAAPTYFLASQTNQTTIWTNWITVTNSSTTADQVWGQWNYQGTGSSAGYGNITYQPPPPRSAEQIEADRQRAAADKKRWEESQRKQREALERAETLLREHLTTEQEEALDRNGKFRVRGSKGGVFDICRGNVIEYDPASDRRKASVCIHARSHVPEPDNMLAKKFLLEADEDEFRRIGNFSG
jgi:hypothetical protein